ncbi:MAG: hypothetical protein ABFC80_09225 [Coriobacteriales bacterium]|nr:hypothetical protein [Actinomycetes bacterium]
MIEASEVVDLVMALVLVPIAMASARALPRGCRSYLEGWLAAMLAGYSLTILEGFFYPVVLNAVEHTCYAAAGVMALLTLLEVRRALSEYER